MITTGDIITITDFQEGTKYVLPRAPSTYALGDRLELYPNPDRSYIVCNGDAITGYCVCVKDDPSIPIGFVVQYVDGTPCFRITQMGYEPQQITMSIIGKHRGPIPNRPRIGSVVVHMNVQRVPP